MYLIFDTNIWIYLANGFNPETNNYEDGLHFKILESLKHLVSTGRIQLLTTDLIQTEWQRNKEMRFSLIERHKRVLEAQKNNLKGIKDKLDEQDRPMVDDIIKKFERKVQNEIQNNQKHIEEVEDLLNNYTIKFPISQEVKVRVTDWAVNKNAPFKGDKSNSTADALILFGSIEYLKSISKVDFLGEPVRIFQESIFISGNTKNFSDSLNKEQIHQDLEPVISEESMKYGTSLSKVINSIEETFKEEEVHSIEEDIDALDETYCEICEPSEEKIFANYIRFGGPFEIQSQKVEKPVKLTTLFRSKLTTFSGPN